MLSGSIVVYVLSNRHPVHVHLSILVESIAVRSHLKPLTVLAFWIRSGIGFQLSTTLLETTNIRIGLYLPLFVFDQACIASGRGGVDPKEAAGRYQRQAARVPRQVQAQEVFYQGNLY